MAKYVKGATDTLDMRQIAKLANVHQSTVSKVLNGYKDVGEETIRRVLEITKRTGFERDQRGMRLRKQKTYSIGVILRSGLRNIHPVEILRGIATVLDDSGAYDMLVSFPQMGPAEHDYAKLFRQKKVDGIIIVFPDSDNPTLATLEASSFPTVLVNSSSGDLDCVGNDNTGGATAAVEHLLARGRTRIGIIRGRQTLPDFVERRDAYLAVLRKHGLPYSAELDAEGDIPGETQGYTAMKKLLSGKPDAVFCVTDMMAIGAMNAIQDAGLRVPEDIAVAGYDDILQAAVVTPPLTTVRQPFFELGVESARMVLARIEGRAQGQQAKILSTELIIRKST